MRAIARAMFFLLSIPAISLAQVGLNVDVEAAVRAKFADTQVMIDIARCESRFRQYTDTGNPLYGGYQAKMVGVFQVYEDIHAEYAKGLGMDIYTLEGNLAYGKHLYDREGTQPWLSSFPCWGSENQAQSQDSSNDEITINLSMGMEHPQILLLQKKLNEKGYTVSPDGPGSPGNETMKFGALTRAAVRKYQCAENIACNGDEHSTGYGFVGAKTRAALKSLFVAPPLPVEIASTTSTSEYTPEQQQQIIDLQAQIVELTKVLNALLAAR